MPTLELGIELAKHLTQRGAQRVIDGLRKEVRTRRHKVGRDTEGRALFDPAFDEHTCLVDLECLAERFEPLFD